MLRRQFPRQVSTLHLEGRPVLAAMSRHYQGVIIMSADPFEALILTVLSQNRTGDTVRAGLPAAGRPLRRHDTPSAREPARTRAGRGHPVRRAVQGRPARRRPPAMIAAEGRTRSTSHLRTRRAGHGLPAALPGVGAQDRRLRAGLRRADHRHAAGRHPPVPGRGPPRPDHATTAATPRPPARRAHPRPARLRPRPRPRAFPVPARRPQHLHRRHPELPATASCAAHCRHATTRAPGRHTQ